PNTGPSRALNVKLMKLMTPVADPPNSGGLASLITEYGNIAAPDATPSRMPTTGPRRISGSPKRIHANTTSIASAPPKMTGLRRPNLSDTNPSNGQPTIQPRGIVAASMTADSYSRPRAS